MKFCCENFKFSWSLRRESGINIRIIKYDTEEKKMLEINDNYNFVMTTGYEKGAFMVPHTYIKYCPHCGKKLRRFYKKDSYVNENNKSFLKFA